MGKGGPRNNGSPGLLRNPAAWRPPALEEDRRANMGAYRTLAVLLAWLILRAQVPGFAEPGEDRIFWSDGEGIYWSNPEEGTRHRIVAADTRRPGKIAVDIHGGKIYWVDRRGASIQWSDLDGSSSESLIGLYSRMGEGLIESPVFEIDLDLDLHRRKIYFSVVTWEGDYLDGGVYRANLDGSEIEFLERLSHFPSRTWHWTWSTTRSTGRIHGSALSADRASMVPAWRMS